MLLRLEEKCRYIKLSHSIIYPTYIQIYGRGRLEKLRNLLDFASFDKPPRLTDREVRATLLKKKSGRQTCQKRPQIQVRDGGDEKSGGE